MLVTDNMQDTYYQGLSGQSTCYVGLDFGENIIVSLNKVVFLPRIDS